MPGCLTRIAKHTLPSLTPRRTAIDNLEGVQAAKALIFDLDGVIVDSTPMHTTAWERYLERHGVVPTAVRSRMLGLHNDDVVRRLFGEGLSPAEIARHVVEKEALYREMIGPRLGEFLVPGIKEFLAGMEETPMAVASNAEAANVEFVLDRSGLRSYFRVVIDGNQVSRPKPQPDIYLETARRLNARPSDCLVFEDSQVGVRAALAAGCRVIGVSTSTSDLPGTALVIADFTDRRLQGLATIQK